MNTKTVAISSAVLAILLIVAWALFFRGGISSGVGIYQEEATACRDRIFFDMMQSQDIEFEEDRAWHQVKEDTLYIGGMLTRLNDAGKRIGYEYSCTIRNKSIVHTAVN